MSKQTLALAAALASDKTTHDFAGSVRDGLILASHASANGLASDLTTLTAEYAAFLTFMGSDKSGDAPSGTVVNPKQAKNTRLKAQRVEIKDENGARVPLGGDNNDEVQYTTIFVDNPNYNPDLPTHVFQSTTGLQVDGEGRLQGTEVSLDVLLRRLTLASVIEALQDQDVEYNGQTIKVKELLETSTTI